MEKTNKRFKAIFFLFCLSLVLLAGRLIYIQLIWGEELAESATSQHKMVLMGMDTRGVVLDRNLKPLTGGTKEYYYIISKMEKIPEIKELELFLKARQIASKESGFYVFRSEYYDKEKGKYLKEEYDTYIFEKESRYADNQTACHLLGYLNEDEQRGVSGLELMYESTLLPTEDTLNLWGDAAGGLLKGYVPAVSVSKKKETLESGLVTTIDRRLQYICEKALEETGRSGAVVVSDCNTGEILAWASAPVFNPNNIEEYLDEDDNCLVDKVCQGSYAPGSVFKIVTAAAALESGVASKETGYRCEGSVTVEGVTVTCSTGGEDGHGKINMKEAMAQSCNCYFAQLGAEVGCKEIIETASRMGLGKKCFENFPGENAGNLSSTEELFASDITNISIGQGTLLVTPLQMVQMTSVIANGGILVGPKLIFTEEKNHLRVISKTTAETIDEMLEEVMLTGTASGEWILPVRGKTGTAEAALLGEQINNCFFSGYFYVAEKMYAVTVLVENGITGGTSAVPVFKTIHNYFADNL